MPVYLYQCTKCKREIEISHKISDPPITHQKHIKFGGNGSACNGKLKRLIAGRTSFRLKGCGWTGKSC